MCMGFISQMTEDLEVGPKLLMLIRETQELWISTEGYMYLKEHQEHMPPSSGLPADSVAAQSSSAGECVVNISHNLNTLYTE